MHNRHDSALKMSVETCEWALVRTSAKCVSLFIPTYPANVLFEAKVGFPHNLELRARISRKKRAMTIKETIDGPLPEIQHIW